VAGRQPRRPLEKPMQGADQVNEELEVGYDRGFEHSWHMAERVGRVVMVLFVGAGAAGFLGRGPYSHQTVKTAGSNISVDFEPVARSQTGTQVTLHLHNPTSAPTLDLFIGSTAVEPMGLQRIVPEPTEMKAVDGGLVLTVPVPSGTTDADLRLMLLPVGVGPVNLVARLSGYGEQRWTQFVVP